MLKFCRGEFKVTNKKGMIEYYHFSISNEVLDESLLITAAKSTRGKSNGEMLSIDKTDNTGTQ